MTQAFVGTNKKAVDSNELQELIRRCISGQSWYFLRWPHQVSGFQPGSPTDFSCIEGQVFNRDRELRWQRRGKSYEVLLLSSTAIDEPGLEQLGNGWTMKDLPANFYPETETRFPQGLVVSKADDDEVLDIGQRYFIDENSACVQFIALRMV